MPIVLMLMSLLSFSSVHASQVARGEQYFFDYCSGCHSLKYVDSRSISTHQAILRQGRWRASIKPQDAQQWFGQIPPDLSLEAQHHSRDWIRAYLLGFYDDKAHPFGRNNHVFEHVAMPDVLYSSGENREAMVDDIAAFLDLVSYPERRIRYWIGGAVMLICLFALWLTWGLKKLFNTLHD